MIFRFIAHIISTCINWIFPPRKSEQTIYPLSEKDILLFPKAKPIDTQTHALFSYKDPRVTSLIWEIKYHKNIRALSLITPLLADVIHAEYSDKTLFEKYQHCILLPVPSTNTRINTYGYVHTHFICEALTPLLPSNITYSPNVLQKIKDIVKYYKFYKVLEIDNLKDIPEEDEKYYNFFSLFFDDTFKQSPYYCEPLIPIVSTNCCYA